METWTAFVPVKVKCGGSEYYAKARRTSYLAQLETPFGPVTYTGIRPDYPIGLLYDIQKELILELLAVPGAPEPSDSFYNMVKMAECTKFGNIQKIMSLSKEDHTRLYLSIQEDRPEDYWEIRNKLSGGTRIPIRIYNVL